MTGLLVKAKEDLDRAVPGRGVLGLIPTVSDPKSREQSRVVSLSEPTSPAAEAYRILRTSIRFLWIDWDVRLIQVTGSSAQEGKTTTLSKLAVALASSSLPDSGGPLRLAAPSTASGECPARRGGAEWRERGEQVFGPLLHTGEWFGERL